MAKFVGSDSFTRVCKQAGLTYSHKISESEAEIHYLYTHTHKKEDVRVVFHKSTQEYEIV